VACPHRARILVLTNLLIQVLNLLHLLSHIWEMNLDLDEVIIQPLS